LLPYLCTGSSISSGRLVMVMAAKGHLRTHMPQPTQRFSVMRGLPSAKTMVSSPVRTGGQKYSHSFEHFLGWQRSRLMTAILMASPQLRRTVQVTSHRSTTMNSTYIQSLVLKSFASIFSRLYVYF